MLRTAAGKLKRKIVGGNGVPANSHVFLHIGKTGGTAVRNCAEQLGAPLIVADHDVTLRDALEPRGTRVAIVIRDPADRFVSAFNSRMRAGRPTYDSRWTVEEAVAFQWFSCPNDLAEALYSDNERLQSAARFAMHAISHIRRGYTFYLRSPDFLDANADRLFFVCDIEFLSDRVPDLFAPLGVPGQAVSEVFEPAHRATQPASPLSPPALDNLKTYWTREWEIYEHCARLERHDCQQQVRQTESTTTGR